MTGERRWLELRVSSPGQEAADARLAAGLLSLGGRAVEDRDGMLLTHVEEPEDVERFLAQAGAHLRSLTDGRPVALEHRWQRHEDWAESWKRGLGVRRITPRLVVAPSWLTVEPRPGERVVVLDPGMAFGTAEHGTTRGALRLLDAADPSGAEILDLGAGSGILTIAALLLGARDAVAVEGDPLACEALEENLGRNGVAERVRLVERWADEELLRGLPAWELVVANIEWAKLRRLAPALVSCVAPGGRLVMSGLQRGELPEAVGVAGRDGLVEVARDADGAWRSILFTRPEA